MKKKKKATKAAGGARKQAEPQMGVASIAARRFEDETKRMLGTHYTNKHGVRRGG